MVHRLSTLSFARRLAARLPDGPGLIAALTRPQVVDILETLDRHDHGRFFILAAYQIVKSAIGQVHLARNHHLRPAKAGWYGPTDKFQGDFYRLKLEPLLDASPDLLHCRFTKTPPPFARGELSVDRNRYTVSRHVYTEGAQHSLLSAATEPDRTGRTLEHIYLDEVHLWQHGWIEQISNRRGASIESQTWKELFMSTGLTRGDHDTQGAEAAAIWDTTDQRTWHTRCPSCRRFCEDRFLHRERDDDPESPITGGYLYERRFLENGLPDGTAIAATLQWVCPRCSVPDPSNSHRYAPRCALPNTPASRELLSGTAERPAGLYVMKNTHAAAHSRGWTFTALTVRDWLGPVLRWEMAQLARQRGDLEPLAATIREEFGGIWNPLKEMRDRRLRPAGGYKMADLATWGRSSRDAPWSRAAAHTSLRAWWPQAGFDHRGEPYLVATVDVHRDWFRLVIRAWNDKSQSRLLLTDTITTPGRIAEIGDLLGVMRERTVLDRRHVPESVRMWCAQYRWRSLLGEDDKDYLHPDGVRRVISPPRATAPFQGKRDRPHWVDPGVEVIENNFAKWSCLRRLLLLRQLASNDGTPLFTAADDAPAWYFTELDDYTAIPKFKDGLEFTEYRSNSNDHAADCEIMGIAVASALNLTGGESITPPPPAELTPPTR